MIRRRIALAVAFVLTASSAWADSWALPKVRKTESKGGGYRFVATPAREAKAPAKSAVGLLERKKADGGYETVWEGPLRNPMAPVSALVAADGSRVITFDNWHSVGYDHEVVVIYGEAGKLVRQFALEDLLTAEEIARVPTSVSSRWWSEGRSLDEKAGELVLHASNGGDFMQPPKDGKVIEVRIRLSDGKILKKGVVTLPPKPAEPAAKADAGP